MSGSDILYMVRHAIGIDTFTAGPFLYMTIRGIIVYFVGISLARFNKKLMGIRTPFNFILFIMLGSIFATAIVDGTLFLPIICATLLLFLLNGLMTMLAYYIPGVERFMKGHSSELVKEGEIQWRAMRRNFITRNELLNELHTQLHTNNLEAVKSAVLASDGTINFILNGETEAM